MKRRRLILAILFAFPVICSAASKEIVELQRDVAQLQDQVRTLQSAFDTKMTALTMTVQQSVDAANKANNAIVGLQGGIQEQMRQQGKEVVGPVANVGTKIDEMATAFQQVQNSMADVTARLGNLEQQMKDLSNAVRTMQTPPAPPPSTTGTIWSASHRLERFRLFSPQSRSRPARLALGTRLMRLHSAAVSRLQPAQIPRSRSKTFSRR